MLLFPAASVNVPAPTSMVVAPSALGVNVAVYTVELVDAKLLMDPPLTVISPAAKFVVASLDVNVNDNVLSLVLEPLLFTSEAVIVMVGDVTS